jgi:aspartoacylase
VNINNVALIGGTHGNEIVGCYLIQRFQSQPQLVTYPSFQTYCLIANPQAVAQGVRYIDTDLNRCFQQQDLDNSQNCLTYEQIKAKEIYQDIKTRKIELLIDIHSTTSNMGISIIYSHTQPFLLNLFAYLSKINPQVKIVYHPLDPEENCYLKGICELGFTLEVGAIPQGVTDHNLFGQTETIITQILTYIDNFNQGEFIRQDTLTIYQRFQVLDYPRYQSQISGTIHPDLIHRDYEPITPNQPIFLSFEGQEILYKGDSIVYPIFIGENAYKEKGIALCLTQKKQLTL